MSCDSGLFRCRGNSSSELAGKGLVLWRFRMDRWKSSPFICEVVGTCLPFDTSEDDLGAYRNGDGIGSFQPVATGYT